MTTQNLSHGSGSSSSSNPFQSFNKLFPQLSALTATQKDLELLANTMLDPNARGPLQGSKLPAGYTYFGQFVDHDITLDNTTQLTSPADLTTLVNNETSYFDASCVYGVANNLLDANGLFTIGSNSNGEPDLPRDSINGKALIGDGRNDENLIVSQLQLAFLKFHNKIMGDLKLSNPTFTVNQLVTEARKILTHHYQWLVVENFLRDLCGPYFSRLFDQTGKPLIHSSFQSIYPNMHVEFSGAAYRMGHSMVRDSYYINTAFDQFPIFSPLLPFPLVSIPDLRGSKPLPPNQTITWDSFFPMPFHKGYQVTENMDTFVTQALYSLPMPSVVSDVPNILPLRNLMRGTFTYQLCSGQDLAVQLGIPQNEILRASSGNFIFQTLNIPSQLPPNLTPSDLAHLTSVFGENTPLFYYCLADNHLNGRGEHLGSLTSYVVGQTILCLISNNPDSYIANNFTPTAGKYGCVSSGKYGFAEFFTYALGLPTFTPTDILPSPDANFFDPFENFIKKIALVAHPLQLSLGIPGVALDVIVLPYPGRTIGAYDPTLTLPANTTQTEVNQVATNALKFHVDTTLAVVRFLNNRTILGIAQGLIAPLAPNAPPAAVIPPATLPTLPTLPTPLDPVTPPTVLTPDQKRALAIFNETDIAQFMLRSEAINNVVIAANEVNDALSGVTVPPIVLVV